MLACKLPQVIHTKAECVRAADNAHRILILPVISKPELGNIGGCTEPGDVIAEPPSGVIVRQIEVESIGGDALKIKPDAAIVKAKLIGPRGIDHVGVGK